MKPKLIAAHAALAAGVARVHIAAWRGPGTLDALLAGAGEGTLLEGRAGGRTRPDGNAGGAGEGTLLGGHAGERTLLEGCAGGAGSAAALAVGPGVTSSRKASHG
jgi:hypothetical protein